MAGNALAIVTSAAAGGAAGNSLAWFAPAGTTGPVAVAYTAEVQTVTVTATGGTLTYSFNGVVSSAQAYNVATGTLATQLSTAWGITVGVAGTAGTSYVLTFPASLGNVATVVLGTASLTGGSATIATTTPGTGANPATAIIPTAFKDAGFCDQTGLNVKASDTSKDVTAFGSYFPLRTIITQSKKTFDLIFEETNHTTLEIYHRLPLGATGVAAADGYISGVVDGPPVVQQYAGIFDVVDGTNHLRAYAPYIQNTSIGDLNIPFGEAVKRPVTLTAYPDANGNAIYWYPVVTALAGL